MQLLMVLLLLLLKLLLFFLQFFSALNPVPAPAPVPLPLQSCQAGVLHPLFPLLLDAIPSPVFSGVAVHRASHCTSPTALQCTAVK